MKYQLLQVNFSCTYAFHLLHKLKAIVDLFSFFELVIFMHLKSRFMTFSIVIHYYLFLIRRVIVFRVFVGRTRITDQLSRLPRF
jgi:hypothetical protein